MGSYTLKTTAVMLALDFVFNVALGIVYFSIFDIPDNLWGEFWQLLGSVYAVRTLIWIGIRVQLVRPLDVWLARKEDEYDSELIRRAARAIYNFPLVYTVFYSLLFFFFYVIVTLVLVFGDHGVQLGRSALIPGLLFACSMGCGGFVVGFPLNLALFGPIAARISLPAQQRGESLPGLRLSLQLKMLMLGLCLVVAPAGLFLCVMGMGDLQTRSQVALQAARAGSPDALLEGQQLFRLRDNGDGLRGLDEASIQYHQRSPWLLKTLEGIEESGFETRHQVAIFKEGSRVYLVTYERSGDLQGTWLAVLLCAVFAMLASWLMARSVADPVSRIARVVDHIIDTGDIDRDELSPVCFKDEVGRLAEGTNQMVERLADSRAKLERKNAELERAYVVKGQFLANMSHELRTPLNAIIGFSKLMLRKTKKILPERQVKNLNLIHQSGQNLLALVNDLLDFERIEAGRLTVSLQEVDVKQLGEQLLETLAPQAEAKGLSLAVECPHQQLTVFTDPERMRQILVNLTTNAIKYSDSGHVQVELRRTEKRFEFSVSDQGLGIPEEQLKVIFNPFHQVDASNTRERGGAGLGLAIVHKLAGLMGGSMEVESRVGEGSTFRFVMPLSAELKEPHGGIENLKPQGIGPEVLVIDDQPSFLELIYTELTEAGFRVYLASGGEEGLEMLKEIQPAVILLDIVMPGLSGWEVLKSIRAHPETADLPVVITSVLDNQPVGYELGISGWLTKPIDMARFHEILDLNRVTGDILVVEDDPGTQQLLSEELSHPCRLAGSVEEARRQLESAAPGAVVLDLGLPDGDGFEVLDILRQLNLRVPVVVYTARDLSEDDMQRLNDRLVEVVQKQGDQGLARLLKVLSVSPNRS